MNTVFLSPHFPPNFRHFVTRLKACGANVLGLADEPYESLHQDLKGNLSEYYRVGDMHDYDQLVRAMGHLTHRWGKLDHIDSHNEYWLETEARLRSDFNIGGIQASEIDKIKRKSQMKLIFQAAGLKPARGSVCRTEKELRCLIDTLNYPVVAKPDIGVGAARTFKICNEGDLSRYLQEKSSVDYIVEEFVGGQIITYDGLVDAEGKLIFSSSLRYSQGVMEAVNENIDIFYHTVREIEPDVEAAGLSTLKAFDVRARLFHFEFFLNEGRKITPLEVNIRPPGGLTMDMFNFMLDRDCYRLWAEMITGARPQKVESRPYFVMYVGRKKDKSYRHCHDELVQACKDVLVHHERIDEVFAPAIGNYGYILRSPELPPLYKTAAWIQETAQA